MPGPRKIAIGPKRSSLLPKNERTASRYAFAGIDVARTQRPFGSLVYLGILTVMAKVMVSMPDDLLAEVDAEASRAGTSRSAVMRDFADAALRRRRTDRAAAMRSLLRDASPHGGGAAEQVKATRPGA